VLSPPLDQDFCFQRGVENLAVEELVTELPIEGFHIPILPGRSGLDEERVDADAGEPLAHHRRGEFRPIVGADVRGHSALDEEVGQAVQHVVAAQSATDIDRQALAGVFIDQSEHPKRSPLTGARLHEVVAPDVIPVLGPEPHA